MESFPIFPATFVYFSNNDDDDDDGWLTAMVAICFKERSFTGKSPQIRMSAFFVEIFFFFGKEDLLTF